MLPYGVVLVVALLAGCLWLLMQYRADRQRASRFDARDPTSFDDWYERHYATAPSPPDKVFVEKALDAFGEAFGIKPTRLRPNDRIDDELRLRGKLSLDDAWQTLDALLAGSFGMTFNWSDEWHTLDDVVRGLAAQYPANAA